MDRKQHVAESVANLVASHPGEPRGVAANWGHGTVVITVRFDDEAPSIQQTLPLDAGKHVSPVTTTQDHPQDVMQGTTIVPTMRVFDPNLHKYMDVDATPDNRDRYPVHCDLCGVWFISRKARGTHKRSAKHKRAAARAAKAAAA